MTVERQRGVVDPVAAAGERVEPADQRGRERSAANRQPVVAAFERFTFAAAVVAVVDIKARVGIRVSRYVGCKAFVAAAGGREAGRVQLPGLSDEKRAAAAACRPFFFELVQRANAVPHRLAFAVAFAVEFERRAADRDDRGQRGRYVRSRGRFVVFVQLGPVVIAVIASGGGDDDAGLGVGGLFDGPQFALRATI